MSDDFRDLTKKVDVISRQVATQTALEFIVEYLGGAFDEDLQKKLMERMNTLPPTQPEINKQELIRAMNAGIIATNTNAVYSCGIRNGIRWCRTLLEDDPPKFEDAIQYAQPEQRWIPVTEKLPDKEDWYIISTDKLAWVAFWNGIEWSGGVVGVFLEDIIAWKPFPAPYRKEGETE